MNPNCCRQLYKFSRFLRQNRFEVERDILGDLKDKPNIKHLIEEVRQSNKSKPKLLPPTSSHKLSLVMEIDEFLAYSFTPDEEGYLTAPLRNYDVYHQLDDYEALLSIYFRKNMSNFLAYACQQFEPIIFSQGIPEYVQVMMKYIDPKGKIKHVFNQQHCNEIIYEEQDIHIFAKDLSLLNRDLKKVVFFDTRPLAGWINPRNLFPSEPFKADYTMITEDMNDFILDLEELRKVKDVQEYLHEAFHTEDILKNAKLI